MAVCWTANVIILDFHNPLLEETQKREFGNSLYFGWAASCLLLLGGALLSCSCSCSCPRREPRGGASASASAPAPSHSSRARYSAVKALPLNGHERRDYV